MSFVLVFLVFSSVVLDSRGFCPRDTSPRLLSWNNVLVLSMSTERDAALQSYLKLIHEETMRVLLEMEEEKAEKIQALKMQLFQDLNAALLEKELQAMRFKLNNLQQMIQTNLNVEAKVDELKAYQTSNELQDLRLRLAALLAELERRDRLETAGNVGRAVNSQPNVSADWLQNGIQSAKSLLQRATLKNTTAKANTKKSNEIRPNAVAVAEPVKRNGVSRNKIIAKEPAKKNGAVPTTPSKRMVKLGPFTPRDDE